MAEPGPQMQDVATPNPPPTPVQAGQQAQQQQQQQDHPAPPVHIPDAQQGQQIVHLNWSHFKPEFSGKSDEDAEALLLHTNDWMTAHHFVECVKVQRCCLTLLNDDRNRNSSRERSFSRSYNNNRNRSTSNSRSRSGSRASTKRDRIRCCKCREYDHFVKYCPTSREEKEIEQLKQMLNLGDEQTSLKSLITSRQDNFSRESSEENLRPEPLNL